MTIRRVPRYGASFPIFADDRVALNGKSKYIRDDKADDGESEGKHEKQRKKPKNQHNYNIMIIC